MLKFILLIAYAVTTIHAHMQLYHPPPLRAFNNPHTQGSPDNELDFPHNCCGKITPMPCRGYLNLLGTPEGAAVVSWAVGSNQTWSMIGPKPYGGNHYGGSCQIGFSTDSGNSFRTVVSYEGNCPHRDGGMGPQGQEFPFTVPHDMPPGEQIFAWTWNNREQEFFLNCAVVNITKGTEVGGGVSTMASKPSAILPYRPTVRPTASPAAFGHSPSMVVYQAEERPNAEHGFEVEDDEDCDDTNNSETKRSIPVFNVAKKFTRLLGSHNQRNVRRSTAVAFSKRPSMLFSNVDNGCTSPKTTAELKYPNPGPEVVEGDGAYPVLLPSGKCV